VKPLLFLFARVCAFSFFIVAAGGSLWGGSFSRDARGTSAASFLKLPVSARAAGLGGAVTALDGDAASLAWNPAGLASIEGHKAMLTHTPYLDQTAYSNGIYAQQGLGGGVAVGFSYFDAGSIDETESDAGATVGSFHPADGAASVGYGRQIRGWAMGLAGKFVTTRVVNSDSTFAVDVGLLAPGLWANRVHVGAAAKNLGGTLTLADTSRSLPQEFSLGAVIRPWPIWLISGDLKFPRDNDPTLALGTEGFWVPQEAWKFAARAGWSGTTDSGLGGLAGVTVGMGASYNALTVDYAYSPVNDLGDAHRVTLGFSF
jgi:hypothetical protein